MNALNTIGYNGNNFITFEKKLPKVASRDLLVEIKAVSINPIDSKLKQILGGSTESPRVLGFDGCGVVKAIGERVSRFKVGDEVYYAGDMTRDGSNANYQLIDERIVGHKPNSLSYAEAAALPLTTVTAWESLFDRLRIGAEDTGKTILLIGGAGGVGSIAIQLAKKVAKLNVIATASRNQSIDWCRKMGADHVLKHDNLPTQFSQQNLIAPDYILCMGVPDDHLEEMIEVIAPQGSICLLANTTSPFDLNLLKPKSIHLVWEMMFTRSKFETLDMIEQGNILNELATLIDNKELMGTLTKTLSPINVDNIEVAHEVIERGEMIGKLAITNE